jgi:CubicO group peptidase (beta-lactamase class C family)
MNSTARSIVVLSALLLVWGGAARSQQPAAAGDLPARVDRLFSVIEPKSAPGCAVAIVQDGTIVLKRGYGLANLDYDVPITPSTIFQVGSMSKQVTATAILLLAQEGKLSLDDDVRKHIKEFPDVGQRVTIRHLLHHTSGVRDQLQLLALTGWRYTQDLITDEDVMELVARQKALNFPPGTQHLYSNTNYTLLAQIVQRVSGQSFRAFTTARIFTPLGMTRTFFRDEFGEVVKGQAAAYVPRALLNRPSPDASAEAVAASAAGGRQDGFRLNPPNSNNVGPTNLLTTVEDLAVWDRHFDDPKLGGPGLVQQLLQKGKLNSGEEIFYAMGLGIDKYRGLTVIEHPGTDGGFAAEFLRFPDQHFTVLLACNRAGSGPANLARRIADMYLADKLGPVDTRIVFTPIALPEKDMAAYPGLYLDPLDKTVIRILRNPNQPSGLLIRREEFLPAAKGVFHSGNAPRTLEFDASGDKPGRVLLKDKGAVINTFTRMTEAPLTAAQIQEYVGEFVSEEIDPVFRVTAEGGKLYLRRVHNAPAVLDPLTTDLFQVGGGRVTMQFVRDAQRRVTGFLFSTTRILNMTFTRK